MSMTMESERLSMVESGCYPELERPGDRKKIAQINVRRHPVIRLTRSEFEEQYKRKTRTEALIEIEEGQKRVAKGREWESPISDFGLLQRIHPGHALTYMRTDRDEAGKRIGRVLGWEDGKVIALREDGAAVEIREGGER